MKYIYLKDENIKSRILKRGIAIDYSFVLFLLFSINKEIYNLTFHRIIVCLNYVICGLIIRAGIYYGIFRKDQDKELKRQEIKKCIFDYLGYVYLPLIFICSLYLLSSENINNLNSFAFNFIAAIIFINIGYAIDRLKLPFWK